MINKGFESDRSNALGSSESAHHNHMIVNARGDSSMVESVTSEKEDFAVRALQSPEPNDVFDLDNDETAGKDASMNIRELEMIADRACATKDPDLEIKKVHKKIIESNKDRP